MQVPRRHRERSFEGTELTSCRRGLRKVRTRMQMIFQDPISSLNPRRRVQDIVAEPLAIWKVGAPQERQVKVPPHVESVGIDPDAAWPASAASSPAASANGSASPGR